MKINLAAASRAVFMMVAVLQLGGCADKATGTIETSALPPAQAQPAASPQLASTDPFAIPSCGGFFQTAEYFLVSRTCRDDAQ